MEIKPDLNEYVAFQKLRNKFAFVYASSATDLDLIKICDKESVDAKKIFFHFFFHFCQNTQSFSFSFSFLKQVSHRRKMVRRQSLRLIEFHFSTKSFHKLISVKFKLIFPRHCSEEKDDVDWNNLSKTHFFVSKCFF